MIHSDVYWRDFTVIQKDFSKTKLLQKGQRQNNTVIKNRFFPCNSTVAQVQWKGKWTQGSERLMQGKGISD